MQRVVLITGANRGLVLETARQKAKLDYRVIFASRDPAGELGASFCPLYVTDNESRQAAYHLDWNKYFSANRQWKNIKEE